MNISKTRMQEILKKYDGGDHALFNWCEEYKDFVNRCCHGNLSQEIDYILKKSMDDYDAPLSYEDLPEQLDEDNFIDWVSREKPEEVKTWLSENGYNENEALKAIDKGDLKRMAEDLDQDREFINQPDIYEWHLISDPLLYRLEQENQIILDDRYWGRQATGQSIQLDSCVIDAFINLLRDNVK